MSKPHGLFYTPAWPTCPVCGVSMRPDTFEFHKIEQCAKWTRQRYLVTTGRTSSRGRPLDQLPRSAAPVPEVKP